MNTLRTFGLIAAATLALVLPAQAYWHAWDAADIDGRHPQSIVDALAAQGVKVERIEERNELILAFVTEDDGSTSLQYFDADNGYGRVYLGGR